MGDLKPDAETNEILRAIWTEIKELGSSLGARIDQTNARLDQTRVELVSRLDQTNSRLDQTNARLSGVEDRVASLEETTNELRRTMVEAEMRVATELVALSGVVHEMKAAFLESRQLEHRVYDHEKRISALEQSH